MKMSTLKNIAIFALAIFLGGVLLVTSQNVQKSEEDLANLRAEITAEKETIDVLEIEWDYLNRPQRLEVLARKLLKMKVPRAQDMADNVDKLQAVTPQGFETLQPPKQKPTRPKPTRASYEKGGAL